jgi:hypothetical protein
MLCIKCQNHQGMANVFDLLVQNAKEFGDEQTAEEMWMKYANEMTEMDFCQVCNPEDEGAETCQICHAWGCSASNHL